MSSGYVIQVGHYAPQEVIISVPNKDGNPSIDVAKSLKTVGAHLLINRARVWGRRVLDSGKLATADGKEIVVEVTNTSYHGKIEFLKWGEAVLGAQAMDIRYLPQSMSLDVEYQDNIQKIKLDPSGKDDSGFIELTAGQNKFNTKTEVLKIQFLKVHPQNKNSESKNPDPKIKGYTYYEVTEASADTASIEKSESKIEAGILVKGLSNKIGSLRNLMELFIDGGVDFGETNLLSNDKDVYKALLIFADQKPEDFVFYTNEFKKVVSDNFEKAKSFKALDLTKAGVIGMLVDNKPQIVFDNVEGKDVEMLSWVLEHYLDESVYEKIKHLKVLCGNLK